MLKEYFGDFQNSPDALVWASEFAKYAQKNPTINIDIMVAWFAGAMKAAKEYKDASVDDTEKRRGETTERVSDNGPFEARGREHTRGSRGGDSPVHPERTEDENEGRINADTD